MSPLSYSALPEHLSGTWLQSSRSSLVGMSNSVTGNEGETESLEGLFGEGFPKSELNLGMDYAMPECIRARGSAEVEVKGPACISVQLSRASKS